MSRQAMESHTSDAGQPRYQWTGRGVPHKLEPGRSRKSPSPSENCVRESGPQALDAGHAQGKFRD